MRASFSNSRVSDVNVSVSNRANTTSTAGSGLALSGDAAPPPPPLPLLPFTPPAAASASASALPRWAARVALPAALHLALAVFLRCACEENGWQFSSFVTCFHVSHDFSVRVTNKPSRSNRWVIDRLS